MIKVKIFTTKTCPWCHKAKEFFNEHHIKYTEVDVAMNKNAAKEMIEASGEMRVPQIWVETDGAKKVIIGFDEPALRSSLNIR